MFKKKTKFQLAHYFHQSKQFYTESEAGPLTAANKHWRPRRHRGRACGTVLRAGKLVPGLGCYGQGPTYKIILLRVPVGCESNLSSQIGL